MLSVQVLVDGCRHRANRMPNQQPKRGRGEAMKGEEFVPEWDVARDDQGNPITLTDDQVGAIWHAIRVVEEVRKSQGYESLWDRPIGINLGKSRLLGRMLLDGLPPTKTKPPHHLGGPAWWLLPGGDPFSSAVGTDR
jgi:hypothetical protein